jgi:2-dehydro-3-deoxyphosphogluconate aldolase/(4S)-4-hydroxy-2-oxoglutarate aldolase
MMIGAGSVSDAPTAAIFMQMGADFIVSPVLNPEVARICNGEKFCGYRVAERSPEISQAEELGAEIVKIFPAAGWGGLIVSGRSKVPARDQHHANRRSRSFGREP